MCRRYMEMMCFWHAKEFKHRKKMFEVVTFCVSKIKGKLNHHGELNRKSRKNTFDLKNKELFMCALSF
jgi:hypothetical protein